MNTVEHPAAVTAEHPLTRLRQDRGLSRRRLAHLAGLDERTLYCIERRGVRPRRSTRIVIALILNCAPSDLDAPINDDAPAGNGRVGKASDATAPAAD